MKRMLLTAVAATLTIGGAAADETTKKKSSNEEATCKMKCCEILKLSEGKVANDELIELLKAALKQIREERRAEFKAFWDGMPGDN